ncbi:MAG: lactate dehydrogenase [Candidatus Tectimicrobiota bacterium]|nr:MAG: lactate dehydrogenase [Candidatus Tectomicrobia bacterium]
MQVAVFSTRSYDRTFLEAANAQFGHALSYFAARLDATTAELARPFPAVCVFVHDDLGAATLERLAAGQTRFIALRCAGFNQVDLRAAARLGFTVCNVPAYSPHAIAEHTVGLMLTLNRKLHRAYLRVRDGNFSLENLLGFDMHGKTVGIVGTGKIGAVVARILLGFGCRVLAYDPYPDDALRALGVTYTALEALLSQADIVTLHCPLTPQTHHLIDAQAIARMKDGVMLINTSRGAVIDTVAVIEALKRQKIGALGLDVYEEEERYFYEDLSAQIIEDDVLARLLTFPNVVITAHQAFFTREAMHAIAHTTLRNLWQLERGEPCPHLVTAERYLAAG